MPIFTFKTLEEMPDDVRSHAKEKADKSGYEVSLVHTSKVDEFRQNNIEVSKKLDTYKGTVDVLAPLWGEGKIEDFVKEVGELRATAQKVQDGSLKASDAIEAEVTKRTETMRGTLETQIREKATESAAWRQKAEAADKTLRQYQVDTAVNALALDAKVGLNPKALPDVLARARAVFEVQADGSLVPKKNGEILRGENGVDPMTPTEWLKGLRKEADYYFLGSSGGGAQGDGGNGSAKFGGMTEKDFNALPPIERLKHANRQSSPAK